MNQDTKRASATWKSLFILGALGAGLYAVAAVAIPVLTSGDAFEVVCDTADGGTAVEIKSDDLVGMLASYTCYVQASESTECACIGGSNVAGPNTSDECYPIGGCAEAQNPQITINGGRFYCLTESLAQASTTLKCLGGLGR